jgi:hypothetical protein
MTSSTRIQLAHDLRHLLMQEMGEDIDLALLLGPPEYARAVLSLCRSCGSSRLARLSEQFARATEDERREQRQISRPLPGPAPLSRVALRSA